MKFFIALSYERRNELRSVISTLENILKTHGHTYETLVFRDLSGMTQTEKMDLAFEKISVVDTLIAEGSTKEVGVGIEMGMARALIKKIILIRKAGSEKSNTMEGILSFPVLEYHTHVDLGDKFERVLQEMN